MYSVLVIDDNTDLRENTSEILELAGYKVFSAENGKIGVEMAIREKPDLIVCDIMMPQLDGYGVLHLLSKNSETRNTPFIFLTAKSERVDLRKGMEMGADDYITKPFEEIELLNAVEVRLKKNSIHKPDYTSDASGLEAFIQDIKASGLVKHLTEHYEVNTYHKKQILYQETKRPRYVFLLISGKVKTLRNHEDGKEYIMTLYSAGDFIGYTQILEDKAYDDTAIILEDAEVLQMPKDDFLQLIYADASITSKFVHLITQHGRENEERMLNLAYSSLRKRVARALIEVDAKFNKDVESSTIEMSREDIAHYIGTATESLIRTLSDFKAENLIQIKEGKIILTEKEKMKNLMN